MTMLEVNGLAVTFGEVTAIHDLDLTAEPGDTVALVGRNGAGKSTTLRVLAGVMPPTRGSLRLADVDGRKDPDALRRLVGYCPDVGGLIPRATPWEHLQLAAQLRGLDANWEARGRRLLESFELTAAADRVTAGFSHGMGRRLSVLLACFAEPSVLLLDEPFDGVDPLGVEATMTAIREARDRGAAVLVSTHLISLAAEACQDAVVLREGAVVNRGPASELRGEYGAARYRELLT